MMKSTLFASALLATSAMMPVNAALILSINPSSQSVTLGNQATVEVILSGLESVSPNEILAAYDIGLNYDPSALSYASGTFYDLSAITLDGGIAPVPDFSVSTLIQWNSTSFASDVALQAAQGDSLTLATLVFDTLSVVTATPLILSYQDLTGLDSLKLDPSIQNGSVTVTDGSATVPEPATVVLMGLGVLGMTAARRGNAKA